MKRSVPFWLVLASLVVFLGNCTREKVILEEQQAFAGDKATFNFNLDSSAGIIQVIVSVDMKYAFSEGYRLEAYLSSPDGNLQNGEIDTRSETDMTPQGIQEGPSKGTTKHRTDEHLLFKITAESGPYFLDIVKSDLGKRVNLSVVKLKIVK